MAVSLDNFKELIAPPALNSTREVFKLLHNRSIRVELKVPYESYLKYKQLDQQLDNDIDNAARAVRDLPSPKAPFFFALKAEAEARFSHAMESLLGKPQVDRLYQLVHYVEIAYLGLGNAIADGRLGKEIGITENQRDQIRITGKKIHDDSENQIMQVRLISHDSILRLLTPHQQELANALLGAYYSGDDGITQNMRDNNQELRDEAILRSEDGRIVNESDIAKEKGVVQVFDNRNDQMLFTMLSRGAIRRELQLSINQFAAYRQFQAKQRSISQELRANEVEIAKEILLPAQQTRLRQIARYQEISIRGYASAITQGNLGTDLHIVDDQKQSLFASISKIENERDSNMRAVRREAHEQLLKELSTEQQRTAGKLLGAYFEYIDGSIVSKRDAYENLAESRKEWQP